MILVVDDDPEMLNIASQTLAGAGYEVLLARDGVDALDLLARTGSSVDLVVADVVLPWLSGPDFVEYLKVRHPRIRVVFVSAYGLDTVREQGVDLDSSTFLAKPYEPEALIGLVERVLAAD